MRKLQQRQRNDLSRSVMDLNMDTTLIAVVEMSLSSWLVAGIVPGVEREPLKKLKPDESALSICSIAGAERQRERDAESRASPWPSSPAATASG